MMRIGLRSLARKLTTEALSPHAGNSKDFFAESKKFVLANKFALSVLSVVVGFMVTQHFKLAMVEKDIEGVNTMMGEMKDDLRAMTTEILGAVREQGSAATKLAIDSEVRRQVDLQQIEMRKLLVKNEVREQLEQKEKEKSS